MDEAKKAWLEADEQMRGHTVAGALDIRLVDIDDDGIVLRMPITNAVRQPMGLLHGGVSMVLAESAASMHSCWKLDMTRFYPVGIEINGTHLRSATDGHVLAKAHVVRKSRTLVVHQIDLYHEESGDHLCTSRVTNLIRERRDTPAAV
jgi:1,4-dihydroxy-2-naphthoyl-CoA hydrolase